jgi:predicted amidohydrolase YtcJ
MTSAAADLVLTSESIYTSLDSEKARGALAIREGRILAFAPLHELDRFIDAETRVEKLGARVILPGFVDSHIHLSAYARGLDRLHCDLPSPDALLALIAEAAEPLPRGQWILGHGWDQNRWARWPSAEELQAVAPHHPVYLTGKSLHAAVANRLAMEMAGIDDDTPDPAGGEFQRDSSGLPTGVLLESAMDVISRQVPRPPPEQLARQIARAQDELWRLGIIGVHDFDGSNCFAALQILADQKKLRIRVLKHLRREFLGQALDLGLRSGFGNKWLRLGNVKVFADGALGPRTAAMLEPYDDVPPSKGILLLDGEEITEIAVEASRGGFGMTIHAIGDRANHEAILALNRLRSQLPEYRPLLPHRIEHVQLLAEEEFGRLAELGVVASMQPIHAISDREMADRAWSGRVWRSYPWRTLLQAGTSLIFGSDAPVESPNPFWGIHAAVTRRAGDIVEPAWVPEQTIPRVQALLAYTTSPAKASGMGGRLGRLQTGFYADLIVLEHDPLLVPEDELHEMRPAGTMTGGVWRYRNFS